MTESLSEATAIVLEELKQWKIGSPAKPSKLFTKSAFDGPADRNYNLKNKRVRKFFRSEKQSVGPNLGWTDDAEPATAAKFARWFFDRSSGGDGPLTYGEQIAIGCGNQPSFIRNEKRTAGANLGWSETPIFEWRLVGGPTGQPIDPNEYLAIYNDKAGECLIYFDRTAGGDVGWPSSQTWGEQIKGKLAEAAKKAAMQLLMKAASGGAG